MKPAFLEPQELRKLWNLIEEQLWMTGRVFLKENSQGKDKKHQLREFTDLPTLPFLEKAGAFTESTAQPSLEKAGADVISITQAATQNACAPSSTTLPALTLSKVSHSLKMESLNRFCVKSGVLFSANLDSGDDS